MIDHFNNAIGTDGFEFVEFTTPDPTRLCEEFECMGFTNVGSHRSKTVTLMRQNDIHFIVNSEPDSDAAKFATLHGDSANAMAFRVGNTAHALELVRERGAVVVEPKVGPMELAIPAVAGVGGSLIYLVDRYGSKNIYDVDFNLEEDAYARAGGYLTHVDHLTHNLNRGNLSTLSSFYERVFDFHEQQRFDIQGQQTGLLSRAMTSACGKIRIPLNEPTDDESQIEEFLDRYHGEGIQHIALHTDDIFDAVDRLSASGIEFQETPDTYYDTVNDRVGNHGLDLEAMHKRGILIDGSKKYGYLLQIFTKDMIGPIFFEIIQRLGNEGFGEGNFQALFESIERDQIQRGVLNVSR